MNRFLACVSLILSITVAACVTTEKKTETLASETLTEERFKAECSDRVSEANHAMLVQLLNQYSTVYPQAAKDAVDAFTGLQRDLFARSEEDGNLSRMRFFFNNLIGLTKPDSLDVETFYRRFSQKLTEQSLFASSKYYRTVNGFFVSRDEYEPLSNISKYFDLLAEVEVIHSYKTKTGLTRKSYPTFAGSGFLASPTRLVTAYHVIEEVFDPNTEHYRIDVKVKGVLYKDAKILKWDSLADIALLELPSAADMPYELYRLLGDSSGLTQGFDMYCLGHHEGYTSTLTKGIVSSVNRRAPEVGAWIQIDAPVSPGASGGLLIGKDNLIYGMIVAGIVYEDINFAVPSNLILEVLDKLEGQDQITRPWLGVKLKPSTDSPGEIMISDVFPSSPLAGLGIQEGIMLTEINGQNVGSIREAQAILYALEAGNIVTVGIKKPMGQEQEYLAVLARRPDYAMYNATRSYEKKASLYPYFGFEVEKNPEYSRQFTIRGESFTLQFYKVSKIRSPSVLEAKGVKEGDLLAFIEDYYVNKTRYVEVLHVSPAHPYKEAQDVFDQIYFLKKEKYDEDIL